VNYRFFIKICLILGSVFLIIFGPDRYSILKTQYDYLTNKISQRVKVQKEYYDLLDFINASKLKGSVSSQVDNEAIEEIKLNFISGYFDLHPKVFIEG
jgi:hypothetical protein